MSVVRGQAAARWSLVAAGIALICLGPVAWAARPVPEPLPDASAGELVRMARDASDVPHSGEALITARLGLPELKQFREASRFLDGTTRAAQWWASPVRWRVAELRINGERDVAHIRRGAADTECPTNQNGVAVWDYNDRRTTILTGTPPLRLPRIDDLLPPQAARRILSAYAGSDRAERIPPRRVAGVVAAGIRVVPGDARSTIEDVSVWVHPANGLPLAVEVHDRVRDHAVLSSEFVTLDLSVPPMTVTAAACPEGGRLQRSTTPDLATEIDQRGPWRLPATLAGLPRADARTSVAGVTGGAATYGKGFTRFVVLPLSPAVAADAIRQSRPLSVKLGVPRGQAFAFERPLLSVVVARGADGEHAYLLTGTVRVELLREAVRELLLKPPPRRRT